MKITSITAQKKNLENVNIFLDNKYWISLSRNQLLELRIFKGLEIDEERKIELEQDSFYNKLYQKCLNYISTRPRSIQEIKTYLWKNKSIPELTEKIVEKLKNMNLLDDYNFAKWYAQGKKDSLKLHGPQKIYAKLAEKGVNQSIIKTVFDEISITELSEEKINKIQVFIDKERIKLEKKGNESFELKQKLTAKLLRKGYSYDQFKSMI